MDAVGAADHHRVAMGAGERDEAVEQAGRRGDQQVGGVAHRPAQGGVDHIGRGEPVVDPTAGRRTDGRLHHIDEGGDIVVRDRLTLEHLVDERSVDRRRVLPAVPGIGGWNQTERGMRLGGEQLHLEPAVETSDVVPHRRHLRRAVAVDHRASLPSPPSQIT